MEVDFDFELKSDKNDLGLHSMKESWLYYLREDGPASKQYSPNSSPSNDEDLSVFSYRDLNLYGTTPILESFSALSFPAILPATNRDTQTSSTTRNDSIHASQSQSQSSTRLEVPTYSGSNSNKSRKRLNNNIHYAESEHDSAFSSHSPSTGSSSGSLYNQESLDSFDQTPRSQSTLLVANESTASSSNKTKRVCSISSVSSSSASSVSKRLYSSNNSVHSSETSARTSGIVTANNPRINFNNSRNSQPERTVPVTNQNNNPVKSKIYLQEELSLPQLIAEVLLPYENVLSSTSTDTSRAPGEPAGAAACRARTELIALQGSTPDSLLPDSMPTVADSPETAGSPTKPTDEPALPEEQPITLSSSPTIDTFDSLKMSNVTPPSLINISPDEFDVSVLKEQHPELFTPEEPPPINEPTAKQFVKYDPFIKNPDIIEDTYEDSLEPRRKMIKFKFSPFSVVESDQSKSLKPPLTNLFIMELEEPNEPLQPLPCGVYEIESTKPYYRITPYPGIYETNDESKDSKASFRRANSPANFIFDEGGLSWKRSKLDSSFDFEFDAPPTPQTPVCMKRVHTAEELSYCNIFSGLYVLDTQTLDQTESNVSQTECSVVKLPQLTGRYRQLAAKPHSRPNLKTGNAITPSLLQDFQMNSTLRNIFA